MPSVSAGIIRAGELVWTDSRGTVDGRRDGAPTDADTQYRIGSITKTFVGVCVMRLRDAGRLDLGDRLEDHVPGSAFGGATIAQLLTHTSGVQSETDGPWWERTPGGDWAALMSSSPVQRMRAASRYHYTNVGYAALGELVARAYGKPWLGVVRQDLLDPLGMSRTTARPAGKAARGLAVHPFTDLLLDEPEHDAGAMGAAGQLWSTVNDLASWAAFSRATLATSCQRTRSRRCASSRRSTTSPVSRGRPARGSDGSYGTSKVGGTRVTAGPCLGSSPDCRSTSRPKTGL
jgi:CubicO group peptidase (beta-lactamase class C family)